MGWKGVTVMDQRVRFIAEYLKVKKRGGRSCRACLTFEKDRE